MVTSEELIKRIFETGKQVIVSSHVNPQNTIYYKKSNIKWLYCVPKYPCQLADLDFKNIQYFNGYSNHCPEIIAPLTAVILGSSIIEVHVTIDKTMNFIDNSVSIDFNELKLLLKLIRQVEKIKK